VIRGDEALAPFVLIFLAMSGFVGVSGLTAALSLTELGGTDFVNISAMALSFFFVLFSVYVYKLVEAVNNSIN
jgi:hypothetical protein